MSLKFTTPDQNRVYSTRLLKDIKELEKEYIDDVNLLLKILPSEDELHTYSAPLPESPKNLDWFEDGVAIVRNKEIVVLVKFGEYHDCGVF